MDFVAPENVGKCIQLTEEFRKLPPDHKASEDKLEVFLSNAVIPFSMPYIQSLLDRNR